jgi:hypothetical protein
MSISGKTPDGLSFRLNVPKQPFHLALMSTISTPIFPFVTLKFKPDMQKQDSVIEVKLPQKYYDLIRPGLGTDELALFIPTQGTIGIWSFDLMITIELMNSFGLLKSFEEWTPVGRDVLLKLAEGKTTNSLRVDEKALKVSEKIVSDLKLLDEVKSASYLPLIIRDIISQNQMDPDTLIYRTAMALFHAKSLSGQAAIMGLEDGAILYLNLIQSDTYKDNKEKFSGIMSQPSDGRATVARVFANFAVASYVYYGITSGEKKT